jgi:eukaryotic-like serine/threonine-protein kinase
LTIAVTAVKPALMPFSSPQKFEQFLLEQRLVEPAQLDDCRRRMGAGGTIDRLITELESRTFLTSYQAQKLRKRETDSLRLGPYKLLYRNASGSFARVFRGASVIDGRMVAIKVLRQRFASDPRMVNLFRREGELGKRLQHKNIVPIHEIGCDDGQHYFTMEFVEGGNFRDFIKIRKKFSPAEATQYVQDMAEALEYALSLGLTHRDLKLSNVLLSSQGVAKLVDFGLAGQDHSLMSMEEEVDRAIEYATLERATNAPDNDPRSDLFFLGAIYYELLTGQPPYPPTRRREERREFRRYRDIPHISDVDKTLPREVTVIVDRLLDVNPSDRYQTPTELLRDLRRFTAAQRAGGDAGQAARGHRSSESDPRGGTGSGVGLPGPESTVIVLETRPKHQDALREYFTKHGYRVLVLTDPLRALARVDALKPSGLILMSEAFESEWQEVYGPAVTRCKKSGTAFVVTVSRSKSFDPKRYPEVNGVKILVGKLTLRDIRKALEQLTGHKPTSAAKDDSGSTSA